MQKNTTDQINQLTLLVNGITLSIYFIINHRPSFMLASTLGLNKSQPTKCWQSHFSLFFIFVNLVNTVCSALVSYVILHKYYKHLCIQIALHNAESTTALTTKTMTFFWSVSQHCIHSSVVVGPFVLQNMVRFNTCTFNNEVFWHLNLQN